MKMDNQMITDSGDEDICTSAEKVGSNDDLLIEILLRLPLISLRLFKSVSKRWLSLITDHSFTLLRNRNPHIDHPLGLLLQASSVFTFVPFNTTTPVKVSPLISSFSFYVNFSFDVNLDDFEVLQSCNGLLICYLPPDNFYVFNPTINLFKHLSLPHVSDPNVLIYKTMAIAFDPTISPHYKLLYPYDDITNPDKTFQIGIYSSETGNWSVYAKTFSYELFRSFYKAVYWNKAIHWIDFSDKVYHFSLDMENPPFIQVETTRILDATTYQDDTLSVSCDCLLLLQRVQPRSSLQMNVYEMKNDYSGWSIKYHVNLDHITREDFIFMPYEPYLLVLSIVLGEKIEEPFLVLEGRGKLIQYNIISKTFYELFDLQPGRPIVTSLTSFLFTPSLAGL